MSHDPAEIAANVLAVARTVVEETGVDPADIAGVGISNQRETTVAWSRTTGEPLCDAVVWQCARARELCDELAAREGVAELVRDTTGLVLSPYYPAGKMAGSSRTFPRLPRPRRRASCAGHHRCLGGLDAHGRRGVPLRLVQCQPHAVFDLRRGCWSEPVCESLWCQSGVPATGDRFRWPVRYNGPGRLFAGARAHPRRARRQPCRLVAQGCHSRGMAKATYGTGSSVMMNVGDEFVASSHGLSSSLAWRMDGVTEYVLEGNVSYAGAVKTWLRDDLELINNPEEVTDLCCRQSGEPRLLYAGVHWPGRAALGERCRGLRLWHDAHHGPCGVRKGRRRVDRLSDLRRDRCDGRGFRRRGTGRASC